MVIKKAKKQEDTAHRVTRKSMLHTFSRIELVLSYTYIELEN